MCRIKTLISLRFSKIFSSQALELLAGGDTLTPLAVPLDIIVMTK